MKAFRSGKKERNQADEKQEGESKPHVDPKSMKVFRKVIFFEPTNSHNVQKRSFNVFCCFWNDGVEEELGCPRCFSIVGRAFWVTSRKVKLVAKPQHWNQKLRIKNYLRNPEKESGQRGSG